MKVSIVNNKKGEDVLVWNEVPCFNYTWNYTYGHVEIKGVGSEYNDFGGKSASYKELLA